MADDERKEEQEVPAPWDRGFRRVAPSPQSSAAPHGGDRERPFRKERPRGGVPTIRRDRNERPADRGEVRPWIRRIALLKTDKGREKEARFLLEGARCVEEVLKSSPGIVVKVILSPDFRNPELSKLLAKAEIEPETVPAHEFDYLASTVSTQGIVAVCNQSALKPHWESAHLVTLVDSVQDPGNLGAIFRTSLAFGMDAVVCGRGTVDPFNPKVVRGSSGTFLRVPFETGCDLAERIRFLRQNGFTIVATSPHARKSLDEIKMRKRVAFLVGNEGNGADQRLIDAADETVRIPMNSALESLNVAVAHGIVAPLLWNARKA